MEPNEAIRHAAFEFPHDPTVQEYVTKMMARAFAAGYTAGVSELRAKQAIPEEPIPYDLIRRAIRESLRKPDCDHQHLSYPEADVNSIIVSLAAAGFTITPHKKEKR